MIACKKWPDYRPAGKTHGANGDRFGLGPDHGPAGASNFRIRAADP
jgi:hypothetical protein